MEQEALLEVVSEQEDTYEDLWQSFVAKCKKPKTDDENEIKTEAEAEGDVFLDKENFKNRLRILDEAIDFGDQKMPLGTNSRENTKAWLNVEKIKEGDFLRVSDRNLRNYINPFSASRMLETSVYPYEESLRLQGLLTLCLQEDSKFRLAFSSNGTFITGKEEEFELTG